MNNTSKLIGKVAHTMNRMVQLYYRKPNARNIRRARHWWNEHLKAGARICTLRRQCHHRWGKERSVKLAGKTFTLASCQKCGSQQVGVTENPNQSLPSPGDAHSPSTAL